MKREAGRRGNSEFRIQNSEWGRRMAGLVLAAAAGCASPKAAQFTDADWVSHSTTGRGCYERGDYRRAADAYGRAQRRARAMDDADALAVAAVNRAMCLLAEGKGGEARAGVDEALADERVSAGRRAELLVAGARAEVALHSADAAIERAEAALKLDPPPAVRAQASLAKSAAESAKNDSAAAAKALSEGLSPKEWGKLPETLRAEQAARRAQIAAMDGRTAEAAALLDEAAALWKKAGRLPEMARALAEAGRQAQASGDLAGACDRFGRASRSLWAQGFQSEAARALEQGVDCSELLQDESVAKRMAELLVTFNGERRLSE